MASDQAVNDIPGLQNEEPQLQLLRARQQFFALATRLSTLQLLLTLVVPLVGATAAVFWPDLRPYVAFTALTIAFMDAALLDRFQRKLIRSAAKVAEEFDCAVLALPWDKFTAGKKLDPEAKYEAASAYTRRKRDDALRNWYPSVVGRAPLHLARIICQRTNLWYDGKLRRHYGSIILSVAFLLVCFLFVCSLIAGLTLTSFVVSVMAPAAPALIWSIREYYRQRDTADLADTIRSEAEAFWGR